MARGGEDGDSDDGGIESNDGDTDSGGNDAATDDTLETVSPAWPTNLRGVTETVVTTRGPHGNWNVAALGVHAGDPVTARTWGRTRTRRNFDRRGGGHVQFTRDPVLFVEAALGVVERETPVLPEADAWVEVTVDRLENGESGGTEWVEWSLDPVDSGIERRVVPATNRGYYAVVEATVAASRLDVEAYDRDTLLERLARLEDLARRCGGRKTREAIDRAAALTDGWDPGSNPE